MRHLTLTIPLDGAGLLERRDGLLQDLAEADARYAEGLSYMLHGVELMIRAHETAPVRVAVAKETRDPALVVEIVPSRLQLERDAFDDPYWDEPWEPH